MAVVVSDTTPLHYLILVGRESILEKLYGTVLIPPAVLTELLMKVKGTLGIIAQAAQSNLLDFAETVQALQRTNMHLDKDIVDDVIREYERAKQRDQS